MSRLPGGILGWVAPLAAEGTAQAGGLGELLLNNVVGLSILVIFAAALVTAFLRSRARDRCLKDFHGFNVTLERKDGKLIWGELRVYSSGFELLYRKPRQDPAGHVEASYIVYGSQVGNMVRALYRFHSELTPANQRRRRRSARRTYRPTLFRWLGRRFRNALNTLRDAVVQSLGVVMGQVKKAHPGSSLLAQDQRLLGVGKELVGVAGNAFDPILERYVGKRVVVQIESGRGTVEYPGILKDYTADFLEVLNVPVRGPAAAVKPPPEGAEGAGGSEEAPGAGTERADEETPPAPRLADIVLPRAVALVRHAGPRERLDWRTFLGLQHRDP